MTVGDVHDVYRNAFKTKYQQRCQDNPNDWIKLQPGDAHEPTDPAGTAADVGLQPAADRATLQGAGSSVRGDPTVAYQQGPEGLCVQLGGERALLLGRDEGRVWGRLCAEARRWLLHAIKKKEISGLLDLIFNSI